MPVNTRQSMDGFDSVNIKALLDELNDYNPQTFNEKALYTAVKYLLTENERLSDAVTKLKGDVSQNKVGAAKANQYSRRDTVIVTGIPIKSDEDIGQIVAQHLSNSGTDVAASDFMAVHRNSREIKTVKIRGKDVIVQPSVTVKFNNLNKKDSVLRGYKNFNTTTKKKRAVCTYQSLDDHYVQLKKSINEYFKDIRTAKISWVHWRSPTCGMAVKVEINGQFKLFKGIHCMYDLLEQINN